MRRLWVALAALGVLLLTTGLIGLPGATPRAQAATSGPTAATFHETVDRVFYQQDGKTVPADPAHPHGYHITMSVSQTQNLRGDEPITVTWSGAHPTGGIVSDPNYGYDGSEQEYPFVLMECRGTARTITPQTCWTQTSTERVQRDDAATSAPAWRADGRAAAAQRAPQVDLPPGKRPATCATQRFERWVPLTSASGKTYYGGGEGCFNLAPEGSDEPTTGIPDNTTYGVTAPDGSGSAQFAVWTSDENATLGCSTTVPCALVAIPIMGIDCDPYFTQVPARDAATVQVPTAGQEARYQSSCERGDSYAAGDPSDGTGTNFNVATSGRLWWSASNWDDRIVVPLGFAVSGSICSVVNHEAPLLAYGSILMTDIAAQWQPTFCTTKGYHPFLHVQATDTEARTLVESGSIKVGLSSDPPPTPFARPIAQAPVAVTGFAVAYNIDGANGQPYDSLRLDARLLAKLLTESYSGDVEQRGSDPALANNPRTILADPEFHALNPGVSTSIPGVVNAAAALISLSNDSDMLEALSSYIAADPAARAWLGGAPDPWGMRVNPNYELASAGSHDAGTTGLTLPVSSWPLLDQFSLAGTGSDACLKNTPYLGQIAHPLSQISQIEQDIEFAIGNSQTVCPTVTDANDPSQLVPRTEGLQPVGHRFVIGIVPLTAVHRYGLRAAALETSSDIRPGTGFSSAAGKTFASPDTAGLEAGVRLLTPEPATGAWTVDYDHLSDDKDAYPGIMPVYADVPTKGLSPAAAARVAQLLTFAAGRGQTPGTANGELAPGALPLTAGDGLGAEVAYTRCVAAQVAAQTGVVPPLSGPCPAASSHPGSGTGTGPSGAGGSGAVSAGAPGAPGAPAPAAATAPATTVPGAGAASTAPGSDTASAPPIATVGEYSPLGRLGLPTALVGGVLLLVSALGLRFGSALASALGGGGGAGTSGRPGRLAGLGRLARLPRPSRPGHGRAPR